MGEEEYAKLFSAEKGAPAKLFRMALETLIIKEKLGTSDRETIEQIRENPYLICSIVSLSLVPNFSLIINVTNAIQNSLALGTLIIKEKLGTSDRETIEQIR